MNTPASVWPLASFLVEEMQVRGWTTLDVASRMESDDPLPTRVLLVDLILAVQSDSMAIDNTTFEKLAEAFNVSSEYLRNLDKTWREHPEAREPFDCPEHLLAGKNFWEFHP
jgi:hypothetical protein